MQEIFQSRYFAGYPDHVIPLHNVEAVVDYRFYTFAKMIATCIVQGGEVPVCFPKPVADYIVNREVSSPTNLDDIPDYDVKDCLSQVHPCLKARVKYFITCMYLYVHRLFWQPPLSSSKTFYMKIGYFHYQCGYNKAINLDDKHKMVHSIWLHFVLFQPYAELEQLQATC